MKIDHIALYVLDLEKMRMFYQTYFHGVAGEKYHNPKTGLQTYFLSFEEGARLELMTRPENKPEESSLYRVGWTHLAINVGSKEKVNQLTEQLENEGYEVVSQPRTTGDGYYESCIKDPEGNQIEITI